MSGKYIAFDCETTGTDPKKCQLLTASFLVLDRDLEELDRLNIALKSSCGYHVYPEALKVNGIDLIKHHDGAMGLDEARQELYSFLKRNKGQYTYVPIGHNIRFDIAFIESSGLMNDDEMRAFFSCGVLDTLVISQFLKLCDKLPQKQRMSLTSLTEYYKIKRQEDKEHSAEYDVIQTVNVLKSMSGNMREQHSKKRKLDK